MNYTRELRDGDLEYLAENLRELDRDEIMAVSEGSVLEALIESVEISEHTWIMDASGVPLGIFGVTPFDERQAIIWMMATDEINDHSIKFLRNSHAIIKQFFEMTGASVLWNYTYAENTLHHAWLEWLGAEFGPPMAIGNQGEKFLPFSIQRGQYV